MKSLVTGGAGFIGSHLVDKLLEIGHEVVVLDNLSTGRIENISHNIEKIEFINEDLNNISKFSSRIQDIDYCIHLAALADIVPSIQRPKDYYDSNVNGTFNLLNSLNISNIKKFIYSASSSCYGIPDLFPTPEDHPIRPQYPYALTKRLGEELIMHWANVYKLPAISLRFFNVYGPRSRTSGTYGAVFGVFLAQKLASKPYTVVGDGEQTRDFTFVTDIVSSIVSSIESNVENEIFNIGSDNTYSVNKLVDLLGGNKIHIPKRPGEPNCTWADITKAKEILGWFPKISLENGVNALIKEIDYWSNAPVWDKDSIEVETRDWFKYLGDDKK